MHRLVPLGIVAALLVVGAAVFVSSHPHAFTTAQAVPTTAAWGEVQPGENVTLDATVLLRGAAWKTTVPWTAKLLSKEFNATYNESVYVPWHITAGDTDPTLNPVTAAVAQTLPGRHYGEHFSFQARSLFGTNDSLKDMSFPRYFGPYNRTVTYNRTTFEAQFGRVQTGDTVPTNRLFNSTVLAVDESSITTRTQAEDGLVLALPKVESVLKIENVDADRLRVEFQPLSNVSFRVSGGDGYFGMADGMYAFTKATDTQVLFRYHPQYSPFLVGEDFNILVDIHPTLQRNTN